MTDYINLPRSALTEEMERNGDLARLLVYLLRKTDGDGEIKTDMSEISRDLNFSRQTLRTLMKKIEANQILTKSSTTRVTKLKFDYQADKPQRQPSHQPNLQPNANQIKTGPPVYVSPPFVGEEFREIWQRYMEYRREIRKPYKSLATEKIAYDKMLKLAHNDPETAQDIIERAILGQWQGLYETKTSHGTKSTSAADAAATRAQSRDRLRSLATGIVSKSSDKLLSLYNGGVPDSDARQD